MIIWRQRHRIAINTFKRAFGVQTCTMGIKSEDNPILRTYAKEA